MRRLRRRTILVVIGILVLFMLQFYTSFNVHYPYSTSNVSRSYYEFDSTCELPHLDPFDPKIQRYYNETKPTVCSRVQPYYSFVEDAKLSLNNSEDLTGIQCFYQIYTCCATDAFNGIRPTERKPIAPNIEVDVGSTADTVAVECMRAGHRVYYNVHAAPSLRKHKETGKKILRTDEDHLSVLLVMHDSVSAAMFKSQMQQTHAYLTEQMGAFDMNGFTKIADNTKPNMYALLTGKRYQKQQDDMADEGLEELVADKYNDRLPLVFKDFDTRNYAVSFIEDEPYIGLFTMGMQGFKNPSFFTHYMYPYYKQRELAGDDRRTDFKFSHLNGTGINLMCLGNENRYDENMKLTETIVRNYAGRRLRSFLYNFQTRITHGVKNMLKTVDVNMVTMLRNLHKDGMLNETVVVFGSDHGARFGHQRETLEGVIEDRMPYFSIAFPPWFLAKHPHIRRALAQNQHRLTTHFDCVLKKHDLAPICLGAKEGLSFINGTQMITTLGVDAVLRARNLALQADVIAALTLEMAKGAKKPFRPEIHELRPHPGQIKSATTLRAVLPSSSKRKISTIALHNKPMRPVQDPYVLRCIPQVHGIVRDTVDFVYSILKTEINSATDNPLVFAERGYVLSCGNFHGEYPSKALDYLAIGIHELAQISERRLERLINPALSNGLPAFLVENGGLNSGFMMMQVTAASLVSENKVLCHPSSADSITTSASQEDHVSMGGFAARKALQVVRNVEKVLAMELLAACQAMEFFKPLSTTEPLERVYNLVRSVSAKLDRDRSMATDIDKVARLLRENKVWECVENEVTMAISRQGSVASLTSMLDDMELERVQSEPDAQTWPADFKPSSNNLLLP